MANRNRPRRFLHMRLRGRGRPPEPRAIRAWAECLLVAKPRSRRRGRVEPLRQDYGQLRMRQSVMNTPLKLGDTSYQHGLGTHSVSRIVVRLRRPAKLFEAQVGVDNDYDTQGKRGSVVFLVEVAGKEAFGPASPRQRQAATRSCRPERRHRVRATGPGRRGWAGVRSGRLGRCGGGSRRRPSDWLDEMPLVARSTGLSPGIPFSFRYGGKPSAELLPAWRQTHDKQSVEGGRERHVRPTPIRPRAWKSPAR